MGRMTVTCPECGFEIDPGTEVRCPCRATDLDPSSNAYGEDLR